MDTNAATPETRKQDLKDTIPPYQLTKEYREALVATIDKHVQSPSERADRIWKSISNRKANSQWDWACFACELLGGISAEQHWMQEFTLPLTKLLYLIHYERALDIHNLTPAQRENISNDLRKLAEKFGGSEGNSGHSSSAPTNAG
jgi:hypothetical protein